MIIFERSIKPRREVGADPDLLWLLFHIDGRWNALTVLNFRQDPDSFKFVEFFICGKEAKDTLLFF